MTWDQLPHPRGLPSLGFCSHSLLARSSTVSSLRQAQPCAGTWPSVVAVDTIYWLTLRWEQEGSGGWCPVPPPALAPKEESAESWRSCHTSTGKCRLRKVALHGRLSACHCACCCSVPGYLELLGSLSALYPLAFVAASRYNDW